MLLLTTGEIAESCHVSIPTVKRWIRDRRLAAIRMTSGHYRVAVEEFERFRRANGIPVSVERRPRIVIIEDDPTLRAELVEALSWDRKHEVQAAGEGYEGLIKVGTFSPHLLILDLRMPGLDGFQVCKHVKGDPATRAIKILAITAYPENDARERILKMGADAFLQKPIQFEAPQGEVSRLMKAHRWLRSY